MKNTVLSIENLVFGYKKTKLIYDNFNLEIQKGEIKSIIGSSGSGKSTLFELITHNLKPISGIINSKKISSIFQDPYSSFHPTYSLIEQIKDAVDDLSELDFLLEKFSLELSILEKKPHQLSGGQLQRCSIIRAILMKPDLLLADEPTSALDNIIALDVMKVLITFTNKFGILIITHDEDLAKWCSDEIINIENNTITYKD
ncbi:MAG: ATP-binding cassette domain-containing protein [Arcobacteraceae bacterium]|jgi:peptide/nickel transport system ATP-binding protein|nr:ATP-binding cassette domain-containing protein [Arcobacteraceae bacterium]